MDKTFAPVTAFDIEPESIVKVDEVEFWAVTKQEDQPVSGINFALDSGDLTISDEQLAALGYVKA